MTDFDRGSSPAPQVKLDFRFADDEDADDLITIVNEAYACEEDPTAATYFRRGGGRIRKDEVKLFIFIA